MDLIQPDSFNHRTETLSTGHTYHFIDQLPDHYDSKRHATLLCLHGFPDLWYGWRYQIGPWVRQGYRVVAPDMLGYGGSSKPTAPEEYTTKRLCADLAALLDVLGVRRAVVVGHDWGSYLAGRFALWQPVRLLALIMISVPYIPPSREYLPLTSVVERAPNLGYQLYFEDPRSSAEVLARLERFVALMFRVPGEGLNSPIHLTSTGALRQVLHSGVQNQLSTVLTDQENSFYVKELSKGMHGPLNYYRTSRYRHEEELGLSPNLPAGLPYLFIWGTQDPTAIPFVMSKAQKFIQRYQDIAIEGCGHWVMVEARDEVTERIATWLQGLTCSHPRIAFRL